MRPLRSIPRRARLLALALLVLGSALTVGVSAGTAKRGGGGGRLHRIKHIVVIYEENHSFDNLYGRWPGVNGLRNADRAHRVQVKEDGSEFKCLPQNDLNLAAAGTECSDSVNGTPFSSHFFNQQRRRATGDGNPFPIDRYIGPDAKTCPKPSDPPPPRNSFGILDPLGAPGGCTRDLEHRFYQEQYQLNGGRQNRYTMGSDAVGLTQGYYDTRQLPIYRYLHSSGHPRYAISDDFFQGAFGGSFLNHQWLIAARTPWFSAVHPATMNSLTDANGMPVTALVGTTGNKGYLYTAKPDGTVPRDAALTEACQNASQDPNSPSRDAHGSICGDWAVNTTQPLSQPYSPGTAASARLPVQSGSTIGDRLSEAKKSWAWYAGGWSNADGREGGPGWTNNGGPVSRQVPPPAGSTTPPTTNPNGCPDPNSNPAAQYPFCPDQKFQFHHQPFNYFANYARSGDNGDGPENAARLEHLRDEQEFIAAAHASTKKCGLRDVSFVKPVGSENEHPGYSSEPNGSDHLVALLKAIEGGACRKNTMVVVNYDEFGGQWDHVSPPGQGNDNGPNDAWGPGTRIPALTITPGLHDRFVVDHKEHDTTSILATIEHRYGLAPVATRDGAANDLSSVFRARPAARRHRR